MIILISSHYELDQNLAKLANTNNFTDILFEELNDFKNKVNEQQKNEVNKASNNIVELIKNNAPRSGNRSEKMALADSFIILKQDEFNNIIFSEDKGYIAHFLEFGTIKQPAQPFMRPAFDSVIPAMEQNIKKLKGVD